MFLIFKKNIFDSYQLNKFFSALLHASMWLPARWLFTFGKHALNKVGRKRNKRTTGNTNNLDDHTADGSLITERQNSMLHVLQVIVNTGELAATGERLRCFTRMSRTASIPNTAHPVLLRPHFLRTNPTLYVMKGKFSILQMH